MEYQKQAAAGAGTPASLKLQQKSDEYISTPTNPPAPLPDKELGPVKRFYNTVTQEYVGGDSSSSFFLFFLFFFFFLFFCFFFLFFYFFSSFSSSSSSSGAAPPLIGGFGLLNDIRPLCSTPDTG